MTREEADYVIKEWNRCGGFISYDSRCQQLYCDENGEDYFSSNFFLDTCKGNNSIENQMNYCRINLENCNLFTSQEINSIMQGWE